MLRLVPTVEEVATSTAAAVQNLSEDPTTLAELAALFMDIVNGLSDGFSWGPVLALAAPFLLGVLRYPIARDFLDRIDGDSSDWLRALLVFASSVVAVVGALIIQGAETATAVAVLFSLFGRDHFQNLLNQIFAAFSSDESDEVE